MNLAVNWVFLCDVGGESHRMRAFINIGAFREGVSGLFGAQGFALTLMLQKT